MATNGKGKGSSNGNSNGHQVPVDDSTSGWQPDFRDRTILSLRENGGIKRIDQTMGQRMDEAGWSQNVYEYCTALFRSGEAKTYDDAWAIITKRVYGERSDSAATQGSVPAPDLSIPDEVVQGGADVVKKELLAMVNKKRDSAKASRDDQNEEPLNDANAYRSITGAAAVGNCETSQARDNGSGGLLEMVSTPKRQGGTMQKPNGESGDLGGSRPPSGGSSDRVDRGLDGSYWFSEPSSRRRP